MALVTLTSTADLKSHLSIKAGDTQHDTLLGWIIELVSKEIEAFLGREIEIGAKTEIFDVRPEQSTFWLKAIPVTSVTSVKNDDDQDWTVEDVDASDYVLVGAYGRIEFKHGYILEDGPQALRVAYQGGLAANTAGVPTWLQQAARFYAAQVFTRRKDLEATSESVGGFSVTSRGPLMMPKIVAEMLADHRHPMAKLYGKRVPRGRGV